MSLVYLGALVVAVTAFALMDARWRLVLFVPGRRAPLAAAATICIGVALFLAWDVAGIALGIFFRGENALMTGVLIAPELPIEEVVFLAFLCYQTLFYAAVARRVQRVRAQRVRAQRVRAQRVRAQRERAQREAAR